jgi:protein gp37
MTELKTQNKTKIEWADVTWNPVGGCTDISHGCKNCYAKQMHRRHYGNPNQKQYSKPFNEIHEREELLKKPFEWKNQSLVFVCSMSDLFHKDVSDEFIKKVFNTMNSSWHHYLVLTKRSDRLKELAPSLTWTPNITAGVTVESSKYKPRIDDLRQVPADNRFLSFEPLIGDLGELTLDGISWVIVGGESGRSQKSLRKIEKDWVISIQAQCIKENIPFLFKQWGHHSFNPDPQDPTIKGDDKKSIKKAKGGRQLDGKIYNNFPEFKEYWGFLADNFLQDEINKLDNKVKVALNKFSKSWITIGESLSLIQEKIDSCGNGKIMKYWQAYLGVDSFQDYCQTKLQFSREAGTQMRQAWEFLNEFRPELLEAPEDITSYTKIRILGPHIEKIREDPTKYEDLLDTTFEKVKTRNEIEKAVKEVFPSAKVIKDDEYWNKYMNGFENKIVGKLPETQHDEFQKLSDQIRKLIVKSAP